MSRRSTCALWTARSTYSDHESDQDTQCPRYHSSVLSTPYRTSLPSGHLLHLLGMLGWTGLSASPA